MASHYGSFAWLSDGSGFYLSTNHEREFNALAFYHFAAGRLRVLKAPERDVDALVLFGDDRYLRGPITPGATPRCP